MLVLAEFTVKIYWDKCQTRQSAAAPAFSADFDISQASPVPAEIKVFPENSFTSVTKFRHKLKVNIDFFTKSGNNGQTEGKMPNFSCTCMQIGPGPISFEIWRYQNQNDEHLKFSFLSENFNQLKVFFHEEFIN